MKERFNVGYGNGNQRLMRCIDCALFHRNVVTKHVCRQILKDKLTRYWRVCLKWLWDLIRGKA